MIKVAVLDDYQDVFQQIIEVENYKDKFEFKIFTSPFINEKEAEYYTDKGIKAIEEGDVDELKRCVRQLSLLLPEEEKKKNPLSGISR